MTEPTDTPRSLPGKDAPRECRRWRKGNQRHASVGPHNPATKPHCGECDPTRMLRTRFGAIPCPNCNPAAERAS